MICATSAVALAAAPKLEAAPRKKAPVAPSAKAKVTPQRGGTVTLPDGSARVRVKPDTVREPTNFTLKVVSKRGEAELRSAVVDAGPPTKHFARPVQVCLTGVEIVEDDADSLCLGFLDESKDPPEWKCEDTCLEHNDDGRYCGRTDHFTNFALLLRADSGGGRSTCDDD